MDWNVAQPQDLQLPFLPGMGPSPAPMGGMGMMPPPEDNTGVGGLLELVNQIRQQFPGLGQMPSAAKRPNFGAMVALQQIMQSPAMQGRYTPGVGPQIAQALLPLLAAKIQGPIMQQEWEQKQALAKNKGLLDLLKIASVMQTNQAKAEQSRTWAAVNRQKLENFMSPQALATQKHQQRMSEIRTEITGREKTAILHEVAAIARAQLSAAEKAKDRASRKEAADILREVQSKKLILFKGQDESGKPSVFSLNQKGEKKFLSHYTPTGPSDLEQYGETGTKPPPEGVWEMLKRWGVIGGGTPPPNVMQPAPPPPAPYSPGTPAAPGGAIDYREFLK